MPLFPPPPVAGTNFSLNATSSSVSLSAGAGIGIGQAASTITMSASNQTSSLSYVKAFGTGVATSTGTIVLAAGANITLNTGASSISIVGPTVPAATNFSLNASSSSVSLVAGANITLNTGASSITIVGAAAGTGGGVVSLNDSAGSLSLSAGAGIGIGQAASIMTVSASVQTSIMSLSAVGLTTISSSGTCSNVLSFSGSGMASIGVQNRVVIMGVPNVVSGIAFGTGAFSQSYLQIFAGANITFNTGASSVTIVGAAGGGGAAISMTQNHPLGMVIDPVTTQELSNSVVWCQPGLFLHRIHVPGTMNLTEVDLAMSIGFGNTTGDGAGTLSRWFAVYSFANSTSISRFISASGTSSWTTGTSTSGTLSSLTQFQGGWSSPLIQPLTFASSTLAAGEYVVANVLIAGGSTGTTNWSGALYGQRAAGNVVASAATNLTSATVGVLSSAGFAAASGISGISHYASPVIWQTGGGTVALAAGTVVMRQSAGVAASTYSNSKFDLTGSNSAAASFYFAQSANLTANTFFVSNLGTVAGSIRTGSTTVQNVSAVGLGALVSSTLCEPDDVILGYVGTGSTTTNYHTPFMAGRMNTGAGPPLSIALTTTAMQATGTALRQPWFRLVGS